LDILSVGASLSQLLPAINGIAKRFAEKRELRERLAGVLSPTLKGLQSSMDDLRENGRKLTGVVRRAGIPLGRSDSTKLCLAWADTCDAIVKVINGLHELGMAAKEVTKYETFMERLKTTDNAAYELLRLLDRSCMDGVLDAREFPTYIKLYGPRRRKARKLEKEAKKATGEAAPLIKKARAVKFTQRLDRRVQQRVNKSLGSLAKTKVLLRPVSRETAAEMAELAPEWIRPLLEFAKQAAQ